MKVQQRELEKEDRLKDLRQMMSETVEEEMRKGRAGGG